MKLMPALLKRSRAASPVEDFCEVTRVFDFSMIAHSSFLKNSFNVGVGIGLQQLVADRFISGRKLLESSKRPKHDCKQGDSKNRILLGLTGLANQILSTSQLQMLEALTDAYALGCFE